VKLLRQAWEKYPFEVLATGVFGITGTIFGAGFIAGRVSGRKATVKVVLQAFEQIWEEGDHGVRRHEA
jgi:hypothetical protein